MAVGSLVVVATLAGCATDAGVDTGPHPVPPATTTEGPPAPAPPPAAAPMDGRMLGSRQAPVTIIEFTDLQCPYCARFALETWPQLRARYVDTGKVLFVARDLPLSFHAFAVPAAVAARCAGAQGRFWEYREALFRGQSRLAAAPYDEIARRFDLDVERFAACRADPATAAAVREDAVLAARNGIATTPTFVIGRIVDGQFHGEIVSGAESFEAFAARIEALASGQ